MSAPGTSIPAGWYPDPADPARGRYWNGIAWTDLYHTPGQPYPAGAEPKAAPGTRGTTAWIWLIVVLPVVPVLLLLFVPWASMFDIDVTAPTAGEGMSGAVGFFLSPWYWSSVVLGWAAYGLAVFFAYRDVRELTARGVPRPFPWAFAFLSSLVYAIGRSIVVARRTGTGYGPIWAEAVVVLLNTAVMVVIVAEIFGGMADFIESLSVMR